MAFLTLDILTGLHKLPLRRKGRLRQMLEVV